MGVSLLTSQEQALLEAFDGDFSTWASLSRNSGLDSRALAAALDRLLAAELCEPVHPELCAGIAVNGYVLTDCGRDLAATIGR